jgi:hypothetical protein
MLNRLDVFVLLLAPVPRNITQPDLLPLIDKDRAGERAVEHRQQLRALGSVIGVVGGDPRDGAGLVVVLQAEASVDQEFVSGGGKAY